jgi:ComF family protein
MRYARNAKLPAWESDVQALDSFFSVRQTARRLGLIVADSLWPAKSLLSHARVDRPGGIETDLWRALAFVGGTICQCCGVPMPEADGPFHICPVCTANPPDLDHARAALVYDDLSRPLVLEMKHAGRQDGLPVFAQWMAHALGDLTRNGPMLIVPVPSHWTRLATRGFNQAARLAFALSKPLAVPCDPQVLIRSRRTPTQKGKSATGRDRNVRGAFRIDQRKSDQLAQSTVILVDDVYTTGATLNACARVLKRAGAAQVIAVTLARVVRPAHVGSATEASELSLALV